MPDTNMEQDSDAHNLVNELSRQDLSKGQKYYLLFLEDGILDEAWDPIRSETVTEAHWKRLRQVLDGGERFTFDNPDTVEVYVEHTSSMRSPSPSAPSSVDQELYKQHEKAWKEVFKGQASEVLLERLSVIAQERIESTASQEAPQTAYDQRPIYARYLPIVQSSGTGKSRLLEEISSVVFVVPVNLRAVEGGFPPPDQQIIDFFRRSGAQQSPLQAMTVWAAFWIALCDMLRIQLSALGTTPAAWKAFFTSDMHYTGHNARRVGFYDSVRDVAQKLLPRKANEIPDDLAPEDLPRKFEVVTLPNGSLSSATSTDAAARLNAVLPVPNPARCAAPIVFAFDECHHLFNQMLASQEVQKRVVSNTSQAQPRKQSTAIPPESMLSCFRRSLRAFPKTPLAVMLSTASSIERHLPPVSLDPSHRISRPTSADESFKPIRPYHLLDWDQTLDAHAVRNAPLGDIRSVVYFGRPLFGSLEKAGHKEQNILRFAFRKLLSLSSNMPDLVNNKDQCLAVIGSVLPLQLSLPSRPPDVLYCQQNRQVESHMAVLEACHPSLGTCVVSRPSEPLLAMAAALAIIGTRVQQCIPLLLRSLRLMMPQGERGEVLAMYMLVMARHRVMSCAIAKDPLKSAGYLQPVSLLDFLQQLNGQIKAEHLPEGGTVRLLQFIKIIEPNFIPHPSDLLLAYRRCCGFACANNQKDIDLIVPICYNRGQQDLSPAMMSYLSIQVKAVAELAEGAQEEVMHKIELFAQSFSHNHPCVQLFLNLGVQVTPKSRYPLQKFHRSLAASQQGGQQEIFQLTLNGLKDVPMFQPQGPANSEDLHFKFNFGTVKEAEDFLRFDGPPEKSPASVLVAQRSNPLAGSGRGHSAFGEGL